ncbi:MAG: DUF72 domain-containing protein [Candidatus Hydrogenedentes bacterium]|nr:DUF72 domain-containing protein [Candidatus Hydrogenedentota bacterium]
MSVRVGPAGWSYDDWKGVVYPPRMPRALHPLEYLSEYFDTVEVNSSFYHPPVSRNCMAWLKKVQGNPRFMFTAKLWQRFTHERGAWPGEAEVRQFCDGIAPLHEAGKLGALLVQFPWSFKRTPENRQWLARVLDTFTVYPLTLEIRHASWNRPEVFDGLAQRRVAFCNIDQPLFSDSLAPTAKVTARVGYVRLHGRNAADWFREDASRDDRYDYLYSHDELGQWLKKIERIREMANDLYVITNNHYAGQAIVNSFELLAGLGKKFTALPPTLVERYPRLNDLLA